ncbi:MAG: anti-sigma factor antagonist [Deltaproteobacteria bacterium HGW-Deltaproteobacteria-19]|jgi:anti-anti-sigma factor|nr:MAG: anti-sigma factor antagonist [Deltaproteobacteria bacterium HGW-Deltaproteobacteria-19]
MEITTTIERDTITVERDIITVTPKGRVDAVTAADFEKELIRLADQGYRYFLLDLHALEYISSAGLRSILAFAKTLKGKDGRLVFTSLQGPVKDVFRISGFGSIFKLCETKEEAFQEF